MSAATSLLADLIGRGVRLWVDGESLEYESPEGVLTAKDLAAMRGCKAELLLALRELERQRDSSSSSAPSPISDFEAGWQAAVARVRVSFRENDVRPSPETVQAAAWLELQRSELEDCLEAIVRGDLTASIDGDAHVFVRNALGSVVRTIR